MDIRYVDVQRVSRYLAKYITKDSFPRTLLRRIRQFTASVKTWVDAKTDWTWGWSPSWLEDWRHFYAAVAWEQSVEGVLVGFAVEA